MEHYFTNNENLKSEFRYIDYKYKIFSFSFLSDNGVFSKDEIDYGSKALVETYLSIENKSLKVLDLGCGYGFIGIVISKVNDSLVTMVDVNKRAVHLTEKNIESNKVNAKVLISDAYSSINEKYDTIITNPPIRAGKDKVLEILINAKDYLNENGSLYYVIRKDQGAKSITKILEDNYRIELIKKDKGFYIYKANRRWLIEKTLIKLYIAIHVCFFEQYSC